MCVHGGESHYLDNHVKYVTTFIINQNIILYAHYWHARRVLPIISIIMYINLHMIIVIIIIISIDCQSFA